VLNLKNTWSVLEDSKIDGIDSLAVSARALFKNFEAKPYDPLNTRKRDFDTDSEQLKLDLAGLLTRIQDFMDDKFLTIPSVMRALDLLAQFEKIKDIGLNLKEKYETVLKQFGRELEEVKRVYQSEKEDPSIGRNLPPLAGRIVWARQLFARIEGPMSVFQTACADLLKAPDAKKIIKSYNKLGHVLMEFEMLYHRGWWQAVDACQSGLNASLLVRRPADGQLLVNIDPQLMQLIKETKIMQKLKLEIPESAKLLCLQEDLLRRHETDLQQLVKEYGSVAALVPAKLEALLQPAREVMEAALEPGLTKLSWSSPNLNVYLSSCYSQLESFEKLLKATDDLINVRINAVLRQMRETALVALPHEEAWHCDEFKTKTYELCESSTAQLELQSSMVERAVMELVDILKKSMSEEQRESESVAHFLRELKDGFAAACLDSVVRCVRKNLDSLRRRLNTRSQGYDDTKVKAPCFKASIALEIPNIVVRPPVTGVQNTVKEAVQMILDVSKGIASWGQDREKDASTLSNLYAVVSEHKEVSKFVGGLASAITSNKKEVTDRLEQLQVYNSLWKEDKDEKTEAFLATEPDLYAFEQEVRRYEEIEVKILALPAAYVAGPLELDSDAFKQGMVSETKAWKQAFGKGLNTKAFNDMSHIFEFCDVLQKQLSRPIKDLEDVRMAMNALKDLREHQIRIDNMLAPVEQSYAILNKYEVVVPRAETERLDTLNYEWQKVLNQSIVVQDHLIQIQPDFKDDLVTAVQKFQGDQQAYVSDYNHKGPMVEGISPAEASDRVGMFQMRFDELWRRYVTYSGGEELFGLSQTDYPELARIKKELSLLTKLYGLYNDVTKTVNGYYDILWKDVDIGKINAELLDFGNRCRKLPKALKEWQAFEDLRRTIDDFAESCPLLESMSNPSMLPRHWKRIADTTGKELDVDNENFQLRGIMEADLLSSKEEIEDICIAAVKEQDIEAKLKQVINEWSGHEVTFSTFKTRGELLINAADVGELMTLMEDSLMVLGSLMSNRYNAPFKPEIQKWVRNLSGEILYFACQ
jgi:dynein heavy chain